MLFSSLTFLYFFIPLVIIAYFSVKNRIWRNVVLLIFSLIFYSWGEPKYLILLIISILIAYISGLLIDYYKNNPKLSKLFLILCTVILLGFLFCYKYLNFFADNIDKIAETSFNLKTILLPIGISFYTFQILSYIIDLYRKQVNVQKNILYFALYVCFFPQLIAGPIVRYKTIEQEILHRKESWNDIIYGTKRFISGLAKKVLIANSVGAVAVHIYSLPDLSGSISYWIAALCYGLQIYFDFSGYSDMAIGLGRIFGFHFLENFNYPYMALSVTDFWRRWHISLSSWFKDYVYIPLGGNRTSKPRWVLNILIVWLLTGLWHGAEWNFIIWGLYYAVWLILEKLLIGRIIEKIPEVLRWIYATVIVVIGWVIFNLTDMSQLNHVLKTMFVFKFTDWPALLSADLSIMKGFVFVLAGILFSFPVFKLTYIKKQHKILQTATVLCYAVLLALCIMHIISSSYNPFIYFRF
ncbi:MAG: Peptidoglycan O-acetyltransferase [Firmicutes bacterium ADurb.Bin146]|nr:MAG: Peptidoglycan O-acetyltransferase [Firmicutes bacterium ADurb.Bin146]